METPASPAPTGLGKISPKCALDDRSAALTLKISLTIRLHCIHNHILLDRTSKCFHNTHQRCGFDHTTPITCQCTDVRAGETCVKSTRMRLIAVIGARAKNQGHVGEATIPTASRSAVPSSAANAAATSVLIRTASACPLTMSGRRDHHRSKHLIVGPVQRVAAHRNHQPIREKERTCQ